MEKGCSGGATLNRPVYEIEAEMELRPYCLLERPETSNLSQSGQEGGARGILASWRNDFKSLLHQCNPDLHQGNPVLHQSNRLLLGPGKTNKQENT